MKTADVQQLMETKFPKLDSILLLSKAEGNLKFLASDQFQRLNETQNAAVLDALHFLQLAKRIVKERLSDETGY